MDPHSDDCVDDGKEKSSAKCPQDIQESNSINKQQVDTPSTPAVKSSVASGGSGETHQSVYSVLGSFSSSMMPCISSNSHPTLPVQEMKSTVKPLEDNEVRLNVYGLTSVNEKICYLGLGVYHSGVQVYGAEWAYGGYPKPIPSIYRMKKPRDLTSLSDINGRFHFIESIEMGKTQFTYDEVKKILTNLGKKDWYGTNYHLLYRNCNNFSNELCTILVNKPIPPWINRVATIFSKFPFLIRILPQEYFTPVALQNKLKEEQALKYKLAKMATDEREDSGEKTASLERSKSNGPTEKSNGGGQFEKDLSEKSVQSQSNESELSENSVSLEKSDKQKQQENVPPKCSSEVMPATVPNENNTDQQSNSEPNPSQPDDLHQAVDSDYKDCQEESANKQQNMNDNKSTE